MFIAGIVSPSGIRSTGGKWQLCLNIVVALPPRPPRLDVFSVFLETFFLLNLPLVTRLLRQVSRTGFLAVIRGQHSFLVAQRVSVQGGCSELVLCGCTRLHSIVLHFNQFVLVSILVRISNISLFKSSKSGLRIVKTQEKDFHYGRST